MPEFWALSNQIQLLSEGSLAPGIQTWLALENPYDFSVSDPEKVPKVGNPEIVAETQLASTYLQGFPSYVWSPETEVKDPTVALALVGALVGPFADAIHNQALLSSLVVCGDGQTYEFAIWLVE